MGAARLVLARLAPAPRREGSGSLSPRFAMHSWWTALTPHSTSYARRAKVGLASCIRLTEVNEAALVGEDHRLHAVTGPKLHEEVADVRLDRCLSDHQRVRDFGVREPASDQLEGLGLALRQLAKSGRPRVGAASL